MRQFVFALTIALTLANSAAAAQKAQRKPAGIASRVLTFLCRESPDSPLAALGMAHLRIDSRDPSAATFGLNIYVQTEKNSFLNKAYSGMASSVPGGYILKVTSAQGTDNTIVHLHPAERTQLPGLPASRSASCEISAEVQSQ